MRKLLAAAAIIAVGVGSSAACASKGYVRNRVGEVNTKVESLSASLEETQERTRKNEVRIEEVNTKTDQVGQRTEAANRAAAEARDAAGAAGMRAEEVDKATKRLIFEVVLSEDQGNFKFNEADLPDEAKLRIDEMINQLKTDSKNIYIEVEGHTDATGGPMVNQKIGQERADAVKRYLYEAHQVPLHKINVISYGEEKPVAPNNTRDGRAQNRRVVIKVLA